MNNWKMFLVAIGLLLVTLAGVATDTSVKYSSIMSGVLLILIGYILIKKDKSNKK